MNDLFTRSWLPTGQSRVADVKEIDLESGMTNNRQLSDSVQRSFEKKAKGIEEDIQQSVSLLELLEETHMKTKGIVKTGEMQDVKREMQGRFAMLKDLAGKTKQKIDALKAENERNRKLEGCGEGTATYRIRMNITNNLVVKFKKVVEKVSVLSDVMKKDNRESVERKIFAITGEVPDREVVDNLVETGKSDEIFQIAIEKQGKASAKTALYEMEERHGVVQEVMKNMMELNDIFSMMANQVEAQGELFDNIEHAVETAKEEVTSGVKQLAKARSFQKESRKLKLYIAIFLIFCACVAAYVFPCVIMKVCS